VDGVGFVGPNSACLGQPTLARITSLRARYMGRRTVGIEFTSGLEAGLAGFKLYRSFSPEGPFGAISESLAPAGDGTQYRIVDRVGPSATEVFYRISIEESSGESAFSGTTSATIPGPRLRGLRGH
jgi:hypothetical protein